MLGPKVITLGDLYSAYFGSKIKHCFCENERHSRNHIEKTTHPQTIIVNALNLKSNCWP